MKSIEKLRQEYGNTQLDETMLDADPIAQFSFWLKEAIAAKLMEPNGMVLATSSPHGRPSSRVVLLKKVQPSGFVFFTHFKSRKAEQIEVHDFVSLTFWWRELYRQVCVEGKVQKISRKESEAYFAKRPRGAQLAAWASQQSSPLASRKELEENFRAIRKRFEGKKIPCPLFWGGFCLLPDRIEFWQGRKNRLHDRFLYIKTNGDWIVSRLAP